jgi:lipoprotein-anchoring transpeptidase ErfK/SrfK
MLVRLTLGVVLVFSPAAPALAYNDPIGRGLAEFLNIFSVQAVPREVVSWRRGYAPGTVVISTGERRLYYVLGTGQAIKYGVGVGRQGFTWSGTKTVTMKQEWPDWRPPAQMLKRRPDLPRHMRGAWTIPLEPARSISVRVCIAFTGRTSRTRSALRFHQAAFE